jgi:type 2A phosphatase activator TIP41
LIFEGVLPAHSESECTAVLNHSSTDEIPTDMLGKDNPIVHYGEVVLFEDELGDKGYSKTNVRFRVMQNCFFVLLRSYTRVDKVLVRIFDTRIFCRLSDPAKAPVELIRDF